MYDKDSQIKILNMELARQNAIFRKYMGRAINPNNSDEYKEAKTKFDAADRRIKELDKELARLVTGGDPLSPHEFEGRFPYLRKQSKQRKSKKQKNVPAGTQIQPSQSKVKLGS